MYGYLAQREERDMLAEFGSEYANYAARTPRFLPLPGSRQQTMRPGH
jgi:protein-S-isoprenylcysteine O-methyltransferase Ste14